MEEFAIRELDKIQADIVEIRKELKAHLIAYSGFKGKFLGIGIAMSISLSIITSLIVALIAKD